MALAQRNRGDKQEKERRIELEHIGVKEDSIHNYETEYNPRSLKHSMLRNVGVI